MKNAWLSLLACSLVGSLAFSACKVEVGDGDGEGGEAGESTGGKTSGGANSGGKSSGGKNSGGASTGGANSGGKASTGGDGGMGGGDDGPMCNELLGTKPASCTVDTTGADAKTKACLACAAAAGNCCNELATCYSTNPNNECAYGGPPDNPGETEYLCIQSCVLAIATDNGGFYEEDDEATCAASCTRCSLISDQTNELITCMHLKCEDECFLP